MTRSLQITLVVVTLSLAGCAGQLGMPTEQQLLNEAGEARVFGRVEVVENGQALDRGSLLSPTSLMLLVRSRAGEQHAAGSVARDGSFDWSLKPGEYLILGYAIEERSSPVTRTRLGRIVGSFSVPRVGAALYIGDLRIESGGQAGRAEVVDRYDEALKHFAASGKLAAEKGLMRLERLPGNYRRVTAICNGDWGIECDDDYRGVRPLQPDGTVRGFPTTKSLQPALEWIPSAKAGVTYDVAIYESYDLPVLRRGGLPGPLVAYAEGLIQPRFVPETALAPKARYSWTVRVRNGDAVSTWSATNYAYFFGVAGTSGGGRMFSFDTPEK